MQTPQTQIKGWTTGRQNLDSAKRLRDFGRLLLRAENAPFWPPSVTVASTKGLMFTMRLGRGSNLMMLSLYSAPQGVI